MDKEAIRTEAAPAPFQGAPYSQAIRAGGLLFVSGQVALQSGSSEPVSDAIGEQTEQVHATDGLAPSAGATSGLFVRAERAPTCSRARLLFRRGTSGFIRAFA